MTRRRAMAAGLIALGGAVVVCVVVAFWAWLGQPGPDSLGELPDTLDGLDAGERDRFLLADATERLGFLKAEFPDDPAIQANCALVSGLVQSRTSDPSLPHLAIAAWIQDLSNGKTGLRVFGLNTRRETDRIVVACMARDGTVLRLVWRFRITVKYPSVIDVMGVLVSYVPLDDLASRAIADDSGALVFVSDHAIGKRMLLPQSTRLAVAIGDRGGALSNFVPVSMVATEQSAPSEIGDSGDSASD